jgi:hypothetical protein
MNIPEWLNAHAKAIVSGMTAGVFMFFAFKDGGITSGEWSTIIAGMLTAGGATWAIPNTPALIGTSVKIEATKTERGPSNL